ncbi:MAG: hypothetical protein K0U72_17980 [Gammaproteobacteria bacterium]|nr:hypothetical protein [Gammaproteobacteria bacterium]
MRILLIVLFGILPALLLMILSFGVMIVGGGMLMDMNPLGLLFIVWAILGVHGLFSLVSATFGMKTGRTLFGLLAGIVAALPVAIVPFFIGAGREFVDLVLAASSAIVVALYLIHELGYARPGSQDANGHFQS